MNTTATNLYPKPTPGATDQRLTVSTAAVPFAALTGGTKTEYVFIDVQLADVFATFDGSDPVATTNGHLFASGYKAFWSRQQATAAKFIRSALTDANIHLTEFSN